MRKIVILLMAALYYCGGCATNPVTGATEFTAFMPSRAEQQKLGDQASPQVEKQLGGRIDNPQLQNYINNVGQKVAGAASKDMPGQKFWFAALNDPKVNALSLPGGYVYITKGMLETMKNEAELAGVLGHEVAHVTAQHVAEQISQETGMNLVLQTVLSAGQTPQGVAMASQLATQMVGLKFSRTHESQADTVGLKYMVEAGYDPAGMTQMLESLESQNAGRPVEFFSTHPSPENRVAAIDKLIQTNYRNAHKGNFGKEAYSQNVLATLK